MFQQTSKIVILILILIVFIFFHSRWWCRRICLAQGPNPASSPNSLATVAGNAHGTANASTTDLSRLLREKGTVKKRWMQSWKKKSISGYIRPFSPAPDQPRPQSTQTITEGPHTPSEEPQPRRVVLPASIAPSWGGWCRVATWR